MNAFCCFRRGMIAVVIAGGLVPAGSRAQVNDPGLGSVDFAGLPLRDALRFLWEKTRQIKGADGRAANIVLVDPGGELGGASITLKLNRAPWSEVLRYTASLAGAETLQDGGTILVGEKKAIETLKLQRSKIVTSPGGEAHAKLLAATTVIGAEFRDAPIGEVADFVREVGAKVGGTGEVSPINVIIKENAAQPVGSRTVTLALAGTNLHELLHLATGLAGCRFRIDARAVVIGEWQDLARPPGGPARAAGPIHAQLAAKRLETIEIPAGATTAEFVEVMRELGGINTLAMAPDAVAASRLALHQVTALELLGYFNEVSGTAYRLDPNALVIINDPAVKERPRPPAIVKPGAKGANGLGFDP